MPMLFMPRGITRPSDIASWLLYLCIIVPSSFVPSMVLSGFTVAGTVLPRLLLGFLVFEVVRRGRPLKLPSVRPLPWLFTIVMPLFGVIVAVILWRTSGGEWGVALDADAYIRREAAREIIGGGSFSGYAQAIATTVVVTFMMGMAIAYRKWRYYAVAVIIVVLTNGVDGGKRIVFAPLLFWFVGKCVIPKRRFGSMYLVGAAAALVALALLEVKVAHTTIVSTLIVRREMIIPSELTAYYLYYFSEHGFVYLRDSVLAVWGLLPKADSSAHTIGTVFFGHPEMNANVNLWGSAFAQFGDIGIVGASVLAGLILKLIDSLAPRPQTARYVVACMCSVSCGLCWLDGAVQTSLLTSGVALFIILLYWFPENELSHLAQSASIDRRVVTGRGQVCNKASKIGSVLPISGL